MKKISEPQVKVIKFENVDVIATSGPETLHQKREMSTNTATVSVTDATGWF